MSRKSSWLVLECGDAEAFGEINTAAGDDRRGAAFKVALRYDRAGLSLDHGVRRRCLSRRLVKVNDIGPEIAAVFVPDPRRDVMMLAVTEPDVLCATKRLTEPKVITTHAHCVEVVRFRSRPHV